jgi:GT2 family glycosyltransferase
VLPLWEVSPPDWIARNRELLGYLAILDSDESRLLAPQEGHLPALWGANMAFRREVFEKVGVFDARLGVKGKKLFRGEESELITRALNGGMRIAFDATLTVYHQIGRDRMRRGYFRKLVFDKAECEVAFRPSNTGRTLWGVPLWLCRLTVAAFWSCLLRTSFKRPDAFESQLHLCSLFGRVWGHWKSLR